MRGQPNGLATSACEAPCRSFPRALSLSLTVKHGILWSSFCFYDNNVWFEPFYTIYLHMKNLLQSTISFSQVPDLPGSHGMLPVFSIRYRVFGIPDIQNDVSKLNDNKI